jgi:hypothetical protein
MKKFIENQKDGNYDDGTKDVETLMQQPSLRSFLFIEIVA